MNLIQLRGIAFVAKASLSSTAVWQSPSEVDWRKARIGRATWADRIRSRFMAADGWFKFQKANLCAKLNSKPKCPRSKAPRFYRRIAKFGFIHALLAYFIPVPNLLSVNYMYEICIFF